MKKLVIFIMTLTFFTLTDHINAMQIITPVEGETTFIEISQKDLTIIKTPINNIKAFSGSKNIDIHIEGKNIFIKYTGLMPEPQELVITGGSGEIYPVVLKPVGIPTETIVLRMREHKTEALEWEMSHDYISLVKELIKGMYLEMPPQGYSIEETTSKKAIKDSFFEDIMPDKVKITLKKRYAGALLIGEVYMVKALQQKVKIEGTPTPPIKTQLNEKDFYKEKVLAVSIENPQLEPEEETVIYIVKKKS